MVEPVVFWLSLLGAFSAGLAYYRFVVFPAHLDSRLEGAIRAFGRAVELRFPNHAGLTEMVVRLARRVGTRIGLGPKRLRELEQAARLRDIGLCAIPYRLVNRRQWNEWSPSEAATYDCHAEVGGAILETIPSLSRHSETVRCHHAPFVPPGSAPFSRVPPVEARILKACAEFVWHSRYLGHEAAIHHLEQGAGTLYDPHIAREVLRLARGTEGPA
jgi:response regulator RpfG family c-di-GMP phosphodiesterase